MEYHKQIIVSVFRWNPGSDCCLQTHPGTETQCSDARIDPASHRREKSEAHTVITFTDPTNTSKHYECDCVSLSVCIDKFVHPRRRSVETAVVRQDCCGKFILNGGARNRRLLPLRTLLLVYHSVSMVPVEGKIAVEICDG